LKKNNVEHAGAIAGAVVGVLMFVIIVVVLLIVCCFYLPRSVLQQSYHFYLTWVN